METNEKIVIYQTNDGETSIDVRLEGETVWLSANQMAALFDRDEKTIRKHINNAINEELSDSVVVAKFATTTRHGAPNCKLLTFIEDDSSYVREVYLVTTYHIFETTWSRDDDLRFLGKQIL